MERITTLAELVAYLPELRKLYHDKPTIAFRDVTEDEFIEGVLREFYQPGSFYFGKRTPLGVVAFLMVTRLRATVGYADVLYASPQAQGRTVDWLKEAKKIMCNYGYKEIKFSTLNTKSAYRRWAKKITAEVESIGYKIRL